MSKNPDKDPLAQIRQLCREVIDKLIGRIPLDSIDVAQRVARKVDPGKRSPALMYLIGIEGIGQLARDELRKYDPPTHSEQMDMFAKNLRELYPIKREEWKGRKKYTPRDQITKSEWFEQVVEAYEKISDGYREHARIARTWGNERTDWPEES